MKRNRRRFPGLSLYFGFGMFFLTVAALYAQQPPGAQNAIPSPFNQRTTAEQDIEQARVFEQLGQLEQAAEFYEQALRKAPLNAQALNTLPRIYLQLQQYDRAIDLLKQQVDRSPASLALRRLLADAFFQAQRTDEARRECEELMVRHPGDEGVIRMVASLFATHGHYRDAAEVYLDARERLGRPHEFSESLASIYTALSDVSGAVTEYVRWASLGVDRFVTVDERIEELVELHNPEAVEQGLMAAVRQFPASREVYALSGNFYLRREKPVEALEQYRKADRMDGGKGRYLLQFAVWAGRENYNLDAIQAYTEALASSTPPDVRSQALLGLADVYRASGQLDEAMDAYEQVIARFPASREGRQALFRRGELELSYRQTPDQALATFRNLLNASPDSLPMEETMFRIADCHVARGSLRDAVVQYKRILESEAGLSPQRVDARARFGLAEMALFQGQLDEGLEQLEEVATAYPGSLWANDALAWSLLIGEMRGRGFETVGAYLQAVLLKRQHKFQEALDAYKQYLGAHADSPIRDRVVFEIGALLESLSRPHEAIAALKDMMEQFMESRLLVDARLSIARIYEERLRDIPQAITEYENILIDFPDYYENDFIRRKIRDLNRLHAPRP